MNKIGLYKICKRCVMDTSDMDITFDEKGYCNHCTLAIASKEFNEKNNERSQQKFDLVLNNIKLKGKNKFSKMCSVKKSKTLIC